VAENAQEVRDKVMSRSTERRKKTVMALWNVLQGMRSKGVHVFSIANVGRVCEQLGVLNTQSIRNSKGKDFRDIIEAFALEIGASTTHQTPTKQTPIEEVISRCIPDLDDRTRLRVKLAMGERAIQEVNRLKELLKRVQVRRALPPDVAMQPATPAEINEGKVLPQIKSIDVTPLKKFLSPEYLRDLGWRIGEDGAIYEGMDRLTPLGFLPTLEQLLEVTITSGLAMSDPQKIPKKPSH
jgi:hypothetical protein